tara:strand:+ start:599 stop:1609 length:1011 start_codon:yes stop_codon:yes gene_type:complete
MLGLGGNNTKKGATVSESRLPAAGGFIKGTYASLGQNYIRQYRLEGITANDSRSALPTGWQCTISGTDVTVYGSTSETSIGSTRGWVIGEGTTGSTGTGPGGGVEWIWPIFANLDSDSDGDPDVFYATPSDRQESGIYIDADNITSGAWEATKPHYLCYESSSGGASNTATFRHPIRTDAIDVSGLAANTKLYIEFWVHAYGSSFGGASNDSGKGLGIAVTTATDSCSSADEAGTGLGFTSDTEGGADILVLKTDGTSLTTKRIGGTGQIQTSGHTDSLSVDNHWAKCIVDISAASGQSDPIYIYFCNFTSHEGLVSNNFFRQDICIGNIGIYHQV